MEGVMSKLKEANEEGDQENILKYVGELNKLWEDSSLDMLQNANKDGFKVEKK